MSRWTGVDALFARLENVPEEILERQGDVIADIVDEAVVHQQSVLRAASTKHGAERMSRGRGRGPGREDTGNMMDTISGSVTREGNKVIGEWGWDDPEPYIFAQDYGLGRVPAARSLYISFIAAREKLSGRLGGSR